MVGSNGRGPHEIDFDLHGIVGIRVINASPADARAIARQLGPIQKPLMRAPDLVIRFVERLSPASPLRYLGVDDAAFSDDAFFVLRSRHNAAVRVQIPFEQIGKPREQTGKPCEIICESGLPAVPLLIPIVNLTALGNGVLPLHASAFLYQGTGVVVTGWSKGGKTETLLAFMARGAEYIGDEWVYLSGDGSRMFGVPEPVTVWDWHLREMPQFRAAVGFRKRARLRALSCLARLANRAAGGGNGKAKGQTGLLTRALPVLKRQLFVHLPPEKAFGTGFGPMSARFDKIFFVASHESSDVAVEPISTQEIAERMVFSLQEERMNFLSYYWKYRFAFPDRANAFVERAEQTQRDLLNRVLAEKEAYAVYHPYPMSIPMLFDVMSPLVTADGPRTAHGVCLRPCGGGE